MKRLSQARTRLQCVYGPAYVRWEKVIVRQGLHFASVIDDKLNKFNMDKNKGIGIYEHEIAFIKAYPHQNKKFKNFLEGHWQNFKLNESAVPPRKFAFTDLSPDTKIKRCEKNNKLSCKILTWSPEAFFLAAA